MLVANEIDDDAQATTKSLIGIAVAIGGNVLISLALNCQKLAHKRLELQKKKEGDISDADSLNVVDAAESADETRPLVMGNGRRDRYTTPRKPPSRPPLIIPRESVSPLRRSGLSRSPITAVPENERVEAVAIEVVGEEVGSDTSGKQITVENIQEEEEQRSINDRNETDYLRSKLWWFGFLLMNVGEFGNFLSYAYAPASVVAPLGTVALIANCVFAPLMLKEKLRKRDFVGVVLAIFGAVTIVGAGKQSDIRLDPAGLLRAITRRPFIIYSIVCVILLIVLGVLSEGPAGRKWVFVDVGLCALFGMQLLLGAQILILTRMTNEGGFTVLATKAVSTLLSLHWIEIFKDWITYPVVAVLAITGVGQIKYLNRALMKFDSKVVIPTFFVSFNLSAIVGSAILYGDFKDVEVHQFTTFLYGIVTTFLGVFFLTRSTEETGQALEQSVVDPEGGTDDGGDSQLSRTRAVLMPPPRGTPGLRTRKSSASLVLSPGQYLLLAASPPREAPSPLRNNSGVSAESPGSISRRRTILWDSGQ